MAHFGDVAGLRFTGSTHDEGAFITKDPATVARLNRHLVAKIEEHRREIELATLDAEPGAATLLVSYGVTAGSVREAVRRARARGRPISALTVRSLWPLPETAIWQALEPVRRVVVAELNPGLYRREIERFADGREVAGVERLDGGLISPDQILEAAL